MGQLHAEAPARARDRLRGRATRARSPQARRRLAARRRASGRSRLASGADAGGAAARGGGDHRLESQFGADRPAPRARPERVRGGGERGQGVAGTRPRIRAPVLAVALRGARIHRSGFRRSAPARAETWLAAAAPEARLFSYRLDAVPVTT